MKNWINLYGKATALLAAVVVIVCGTTTVQADEASASAQKWDLPGCVGDQNGWAPGDTNWTWDKGNPCTMSGATWSVVMQPDPEPGLTTEFKPMTQGLLYNFVRGWVDGSSAFDPPQFYKDKSLATMSSGADTGKFPEDSKSSAIIFKPPKAGSYHLEISGTAGVQMKASGYVSVCVYTLKDKRSVPHMIDRQLVGETGGLDSHPNKLSVDRTVDFGDDEELVVRIQTISPGQAPAGHGSITFDKFTVTTTDK